MNDFDEVLYEEEDDIRDYYTQDRFWKTRDGEVLTLEEMTPSHRENLMAYLVRNAVNVCLQRSYYLQSVVMPNGQQAQWIVEDSIDTELDDMLQDPEGWVRNSPLFRKLRELNDR